MFDDGIENMKREDVITQLSAWLLLPIVTIVLAAGLNYVLAFGTGSPLMLYLL